MFNNRMLAVAAVLVMAVPALGAATPIVVPPVREQLVEGHTVFTVIEIVAKTATNEVRFAAAVAVLVREFRAANNAQRFPGVLWFNDQYLVNPDQNDQAARAFRYPCGGAVMAVNQGDPDPRVVIAELTVNPTTVQADLPDGVDDNTGDVDETFNGVSVTAGDDTQTYTNPPWVKPTPGTYTYNNDYAWVGGDVGPTTVNATNPSATGGATVYSDTVVGTLLGSADAFNLSAPYDYRESYLITDPNDHSWIIDKYNFYTRDQVSTAGGVESQNLDNMDTKLFGDAPANDESEHYPVAFGGELDTVYAYPVWVVNLLGSPVFIPDYGTSFENCLAFKDLIEDIADPGLSALPCAADVNPSNNPLPPFTDDPCMGYEEPSRNDFCYGGQDASYSSGTCPHGTPGNDYPHIKDGEINEPLRQYNALLYFKLQDLRVWDGSTKDHCNFDATIDADPDTPGLEGACNSALSPDTNGCASEQYPWGPNPPQAANDWPCPAGDDNAEGNSHPFHPTTPTSGPTHLEAEECSPQFLTADPNGTDGRRRNPANHGGSSYIAPSMRATDEGWFQTYAPCDYAHTTRQVDIYFSPAGRPFPPPIRWFDVLDLEGSAAPFQDHHLSYPDEP